MPSTLIEIDAIAQQIHLIRGHRIMLDSDLAKLYGVETKVFNQAIKRNLERFPADFMFQLTTEEWADLKSQSVTSKTGSGGRRTLPYVFTEHGVLMSANVLNSTKAINVSIQVVRVFTRLRDMVLHHHELSLRLDELEARYDQNFQVVFEAIRQLMTPPPDDRGPVGFR